MPSNAIPDHQQCILLRKALSAALKVENISALTLVAEITAILFGGTLISLHFIVFYFSVICTCTVFL